LDGITAATPGTDARALMERIERPRDVEEAAHAFEALFVEQLLAELRRSVPEDGLFQKGFAEKTFEQMLDRTYAGLMASRGGVGLADVLLQSWGVDGADGGARAADTTDPLAAGGEA